MKHNYNYCSRSQRLVISMFIIGLFLQGCSSTNGLPFPVKKKQHCIGQQLSISRFGLAKGKKQNRLQARGEEQATSMLFLRDVLLNYANLYNNGSLQGINGHQEKKNHEKGMKREKGQTSKRKRIKSQEYEQGYLNGAKHQRLESTKKAIQEIKETKKKSKCANEKGNVKNLKQKKVKANQQVNDGCIKKRKKPSYKINDKEILGNTNKQVKKRREAPVGLLDLPEGILQDIISYLPFKKRMLIRELSHFFYTISTGYKQVGMIGVANKPDYKPDSKTSIWSIDKVCGITKVIDFGILSSEYGLAWTTETIPSFAFYVLMRRVDNLPREYWTYLRDTQIRDIDLGWNKISDKDLIEFGKSLVGSKVHRVDLWHNKLGPAYVERFAKSLSEDTNIHVVNLSVNKLGAAGAKGFTEHLPRTVHEIDLGSNEIGDEGAAVVAKNVQDKEVKEINLRMNKIKDKGAIEVIKNLQGTSVKILYLSYNEITDEGAMRGAKNILGTTLEELYLECNKITNKGAIAIVKGCQGSKVKRLGLNLNRGITDEGVSEIAENLKGTSLEEIDLRQYKDSPIGKRTQELVIKKYPYIKWIFELEQEEI